MKWRDYWEQIASENDPLVQVGRSRKGVWGTEADLYVVVNHLKSILKLKKRDHLLDLCCGNGLLTRQLARHCAYTLGVDFSAGLIDHAAQHALPGRLEFAQADVCHLGQELPADLHEKTFDKILLHFSFQYLDSYVKGRDAVAEMLPRLRPGGQILIGDVPAQELSHRFYTTPELKLRHLLSRIKGNNMMGKFWRGSELLKIGKELGLEVQRLEQPAHLPYAHYRYDYLLSVQAWPAK